MRVLIDGVAFTAKLSTLEIAGEASRAIVIDNTLVLTPEDVSMLDCALIEATEDEREGLRRAGFQSLVEE
jgi:hypothetical protein